MNQKQLERRRAALQRREGELAGWKAALNALQGETDEERAATERQHVARKIEIAEREIATLRGRIGSREH